MRLAQKNGLLSTAEPMPVILGLIRGQHTGVLLPFTGFVSVLALLQRTEQQVISTTDVLSFHTARGYLGDTVRRCLSSLGRRSGKPLSGHGRSLRMAVETLPSLVNQACLSTSRDL